MIGGTIATSISRDGCLISSRGLISVIRFKSSASNMKKPELFILPIGRRLCWFLATGGMGRGMWLSGFFLLEGYCFEAEDERWPRRAVKKESSSGLGAGAGYC
jgi:hypothetical protein